jgi:hypothetical protein
MKTNTHLWLYLAQLFLEGEMFQAQVVEKIKTKPLMFIDFILQEWCRLWGNVGKYCTARQAIDGNMGHAHRTQKQIPKFMKIGPVGAELFHGDGRR